VINLPNVTLLGIDCINVERLQKALDISSSGIKFGEVKLLTSLPTDDPRKVEIDHIDSVEAYSKFCIQDLLKYVETEYVLIVQYDGFVLNPDSWESEFLKYDYIGAPWLGADWLVNRFNFPKELIGQYVVGNGGFSIRSKKFLEISKNLAEDGVFDQYQPEDIALCVWHRTEVESAGIRFAPIDLAIRFSIEGSGYDKQFGFHGFNWTDISKWIKENPDWNIHQVLNKDK
jgi:hypothetical protein